MARIAGIDLPRKKRIDIALTYIFGIGRTSALQICEKADVPGDSKTEDLADAVQDTLTSIWRKLGEFEGRAALETWVYRFCFLELMNGVRRRRRRPEPMHEDESVAERDDRRVPGPGETEADRELIHRVLDRLGPPAADVIRMKHFEELTFDEIGEQLDVSPNTAKTQYYRGMLRLREYLDAAEAAQ